ncbi:MAG: ABC transporter permease [Deltaproteobacteria bacterium]|nr:ABC transporter permease [Deltaproteobacteria bacterium]
MDLFKKIPPALISFVLLLLCWEGVVRLGVWSENVLPGPLTVGLGMWELACSGLLLKHTVSSLFRVTAGFYLAVVLGVPAGILLGYFVFAKRALNPIVQFFRPISPLAWIPLAMLWFGIGDKPAIFLIFLASFFPLAVSTGAAVESIKKTYFQVAANFAFTKREIFTMIIFPAILPTVLVNLRISLGIAWIVVVAAEMIAVKSGLGFLIIDSRNALRMDYVLDAMIIIGAIGVVLDSVMLRLSMAREVQWGVRGR